MARSVLRRWVLPAVIVGAALAGPVAAAQASNNDIRATLDAYAPKIVNDETAVGKGLSEYPKGKPKPLERALKQEVSTLHALKAALRHETASSTKGRKAKKEIVTGLGLIAGAYTSLRADILAVHGGAVPVAQVDAAVAQDKKGRTKLKAGLRLIKTA